MIESVHTVIICDFISLFIIYFIALTVKFPSYLKQFLPIKLLNGLTLISQLLGYLDSMDKGINAARWLSVFSFNAIHRSIYFVCSTMQLGAKGMFKMK